MYLYLKIDVVKIQKPNASQLYIPYSRRPRGIDDASHARGKKVSKKVFDAYHDNQFFIPFLRRPSGIEDASYVG